MTNNNIKTNQDGRKLIDRTPEIQEILRPTALPWCWPVHSLTRPSVRPSFLPVRPATGAAVQASPSNGTVAVRRFLHEQGRSAAAAAYRRRSVGAASPGIFRRHR